MSLSRRLFLTVVGLVVVAFPARADDKPTRVLFIGNSYTFVNDLPAMLEQLAKAGKQPQLVHGQETPGGCTLEKHVSDGKAVQKIEAGPWDYVVLQEQSTRPLDNRERMFQFARKLDAEIQKNHAKTLLYQTWARQNTPEKQADLSKAYLDLGKELKAQVVPVGMAWERALKEAPELALHGPDKSHPSKAGTYLAACVFYAVIFDKSPEGLPGKMGGITDDEAKKLQAIAWQTVRHLGDRP